MVAARTRLVLAAVLPLCTALLCLVLLDQSERQPLPALQVVAERPPRTRLIVLLLDSLDRSDVERPGSMPALAARLGDAGLHGPMRACLEAITIPCVTAMITGVDHASPLSIAHNFGAAGGLAEDSVLGALRRAGRRVGYVGEPLLARALAGLDHVEGSARDDAETLQAGLRALTRDRLDLLFIHLVSIDEAAHKFTTRSPAYAHTVARLDALVARAVGSLRDDDHVAIVGDHGHTDTGRHIAGVGMQTYAAYFGPRFARRAEPPWRITDHARIWAELFGLRWPTASWVADYFEGRALAAPHHTREQPLRVRSVWLSTLALWLAPLSLWLTFRLGSPSARRLTSMHYASLVGTFGALLALGATFPILRSWYGEPLGTLALFVLTTALGALALCPWLEAAASPAERWLIAAFSGALLCAPPLLAPLAAIQTPLALLGPMLLAMMASAWRERAPARLGALAIVLALTGSLWPAHVVDGLARGFPVYTGLVAALGWVLPLALALAAIVRASGLRSALPLLLGVAATALLMRASANWFALPCALALPLTLVTLCRPAWFGALCFVLPSALWFFFQGNAPQLAPIAACWLIWSLLPGLTMRRQPLLAGAILLLLIWLGCWTTFGARAGGVDFDFYFRWLPAQAGATSGLLPQALLTVAKCLLPTVFGVVLAQQSGALPLRTFVLAEQLARVRLALVLVFLATLSLAVGPGDRTAADATEEAAFWIVALALTGLVSIGARFSKESASGAARATGTIRG